MQPPDPRGAALRSAAWPGLGQWYLGQRSRAVAMGVVAAWLLFLGLVTFTLPFLIALWAWGILDAHEGAKRLQNLRRGPVEGPFRVCPSCGAEQPADFHRCPACGAKLPPLF